LQLLRVHKFEIIKVKGSEISFPNDFKIQGLNLIDEVDKLITRLFPTLVYHSIIVLRKE